MDAVEEVKSRLAIEDVIGEYVNLKRTGRNWKGLSPFSSERTPSFVVSPEKQIWKDFSSGRGGSMFDFVMEVEGLDFKGALELLARKAGVDLEQYRTSSSNKKGPNKEKLYELLELAAKFYQVQFSHNQVALEYVFKTRKFTKQTALDWRLGYSPKNGQALIDFAKSKGFSEAEVTQAGLTSKAYRGGIQDMFRGRLMIPLQDVQGKVIGFTARLLESGDSRAPKYINTPQTVLYDKSRHIYGLHLAKDAIRRGGYSVLVEGNLDVISSHQAGVKQVVATAGTALTEPNLKTLSRFSGDVRLCFDADRAGLAATERAIPIAARCKVSLSIIDLVSGKDPDELINQDPKLWQTAVTESKYVVDWLIDRYKQQLDITSAVGKRKFSDILLPVINSLPDDVEKDHYLSQIAELIGVGRAALEQKRQKADDYNDDKTSRRNIKVDPVAVDRIALENQRVQDNFLCLVLMRPTLRELIDMVNDEMFHSQESKKLLNFLIANPEFDGKTAPDVENLIDYVKIESLLYEELYQGRELNELHEEVVRLRTDLVTRFVKTQKIKLSEAQRQVESDTELRSLQEKDKQLNLLLNQVKGGLNG